MTSVIGSATMATGVMLASAIEIFDDVTKYRETCEPKIKVAHKTNSRNVSHRKKSLSGNLTTSPPS
jgi:hypothetical protein